jgi:hypothetical protein
VLASTRRCGPSGYIQFVLLGPVGTWLIRFFLLVVAGALTRYGVSSSSSYFAIEIVGTLFLFGVASSSLGIEVGVGGYLAGALITSAAIIFTAPPYNIELISTSYHTMIGAVLSFYAAQFEQKIERP